MKENEVHQSLQQLDLYPVHTGLFKPVSNPFLSKPVSNHFKCNCIHTLFVNRLQPRTPNINMQTCKVVNLEQSFQLAHAC